MRVTCPHRGCPIDVPDDMAGARIRCPHCGNLLFVEIEAPVPKPAPARLENQIYDGLPPLSMMMALRRQQVGLADLPPPPEMTEDDWRALAAFEQVLYAETSLRTSLIYSLIATVMNAGIVASAFLASPSNSSSTGLTLLLALPTFFVLLPALIHVFQGHLRLRRLNVDAGVKVLPLVVFGSACAFGGYVIAYAGQMFFLDRERSPCVAVLAAGFNLIAWLDLGKTWLQLRRGLHAIEPPEILHRLVEALAYLTPPAPRA